MSKDNCIWGLIEQPSVEMCSTSWRMAHILGKTNTNAKRTLLEQPQAKKKLHNQLKRDNIQPNMLETLKEGWLSNQNHKNIHSS